MKCKMKTKTLTVKSNTLCFVSFLAYGVTFVNNGSIYFIIVRHGLKNQAKMEEVQMKIIDSLRDHCVYNSEAQKKPNYFSSILGKVAELRTLSRQGIQRMELLRMDTTEISPAPHMIEDIFLSNDLPF